MPTESTPLLHPHTAYLCALLYTLFYISPFYLSPTLRSTPLTSRDAPTVIRARVRAVGLTCAACTVVTVYLLTIHGHATPHEVVHLLGIWPVDPIDVVKVLALTMVLFACSLYEMLLVDGEWRSWGTHALKAAVWDSWTGYRNLLVGPASEELVFRALTIPLFLLADTSPVRIVFLTPLVFGLAHFHHLFGFLQSHTPRGSRWPPLKAWMGGIAQSLFQLLYTSLFGFFAAFVFLRTGNLWAAIVAHSLCNWMGLPRVWGRVGQFEEWMPSTTANGVHNSKRDDDENGPGSPVKVGNSLMQDERVESTAEGMSQSPKNLGFAWSVVYYALIFVGAYGFYRLLWPLTESRNALATF